MRYTYLILSVTIFLCSFIAEERIGYLVGSCFLLFLSVGDNLLEQHSTKTSKSSEKEEPIIMTGCPDEMEDIYRNR